MKDLAGAQTSGIFLLFETLSPNIFFFFLNTEVNIKQAKPKQNTRSNSQTDSSLQEDAGIIFPGKQ